MTKKMTKVHEVELLVTFSDEHITNVPKGQFFFSPENSTVYYNNAFSRIIPMDIQQVEHEGKDYFFYEAINADYSRNVYTLDVEDNDVFLVPDKTIIQFTCLNDQSYHKSFYNDDIALGQYRYRLRSYKPMEVGDTYYILYRGNHWFEVIKQFTHHTVTSEWVEEEKSKDFNKLESNLNEIRDVYAEEIPDLMMLYEMAKI